MSRYRVGCAGMFVLDTHYGMDDMWEAIVATEEGPPGCEVYDTVTKEWIGPSGPEDVEYARLQIASRAARGS